MAIQLTSNIINDLVNKGYVPNTTPKSTSLHKRYNYALDVSIVYSSYKPDQINLSCFFDIKRLIDNFSLTTFPLSEIQKQLTEIFGHCFAQIYNYGEFQIVFYIYIYEEENLIKWVDLLEEDANEFTYLVFDLITDMLKENAKKIFFNILNNVEDVDFFDKIQQFFILFRFYDKISNNEEILKYVDTFQDNNKVSEFIKILKDINEEDYE